MACGSVEPSAAVAAADGGGSMHWGPAAFADAVTVAHRAGPTPVDHTAQE